MRHLKNPYLAILLVPLVAFLFLMHFRVEPDTINLVGRVYVFAILGYVGARYVGKAPMLMIAQDMSAEARNVVGWGLAVLGFMLQIGYGWLYIAYDRPLFLSSQYWSAAILVLVATGLTLVASSVPRFPPFGSGPTGLSVLASFCVATMSALGMMFIGHIPQLIAVIKGFWMGLIHAL